MKKRPKAAQSFIRASVSIYRTYARILCGIAGGKDGRKAGGDDGPTMALQTIVIIASERKLVLRWEL